MRKLLIIVSLFMIILMMTGCTGGVLAPFSGDSEGSTGSSSLSSDSEVTFNMHVMSQCPYGLQVENAMIPVAEKFKDALDLQIDYIADDIGGGNFKALHGQPEVEGNIVQLCAKKHNEDKYLKLIECMNKDARAIPGNWKSCADELELNKDKIQGCFDGEEGKDLLRASIKKSNEANARGSPTMFINGQPYQGGRDTLDFHRAVCAALNGDHDECRDMPACASDADCTAESDKIGTCENPGEKQAKCVYTEPVKVTLTILNDKECKTCDTTPILSQLQQLFKGLQGDHVDVSSSKGQQLVKDLGVTVVPVYLFDNALTKTAAFSQNAQLGGAFDQVTDGYRLKDALTGASWFIDEEARKKHLAAIGVTKGDNKPQIDFFVMSYCPYGNQAEEAIKGAYDVLKDKAEFNPRWVVYSNYQGGGPSYCLEGHDELCSMHGQIELNQDLREDCVKQVHGIDKWFEFALEMNKKCDYKNADTCWVDVAKGLSIDTDKVSECVDTKGVAIATENKALGDKLGVQGSPSVFIDGEEYNGPRTAQGYLSALCAAYEDKPDECNNIPEPTPAQAQQAAAPNIGAGCGV